MIMRLMMMMMATMRLLIDPTVADYDDNDCDE